MAVRTCYLFISCESAWIVKVALSHLRLSTILSLKLVVCLAKNVHLFALSQISHPLMDDQILTPLAFGSLRIARVAVRVE
jgi:hypothetical protein